MGHIRTVLSVMTAPNGRGILDELTIVDCDVTLVRRSTRNYEMVITLAPGEDYVMEFTTAAGDVMLTVVDTPVEPGPMAA